jgi:uncharacterized membrane-anchored protein YitT (DUF2179 family)
MSNKPPKPTYQPTTTLWHEIRRWLTMLIGITLGALGYALFQVPFNLAAGGVSGIAIIINHFTGWSIGGMYLLMNIPLLILGYFYLGRWGFVLRTVICVVTFSALTDLFIAYLPSYLDHYPINNDILLNAIYAALIGGIGSGLVYQAGSTSGGTAILGRIIQMKTGTPLSQVYLYTDGIIVIAAGITFGWETAMYAMLTLFLSGVATDYTLEGPSSVRTATIITNNPDEVSHALMDGLGRGVSSWQVMGGYTGKTRHLLLCTIYRPQVNDLKRIVAHVDRQAFVTIGVAHQALGSGFAPLTDD